MLLFPMYLMQKIIVSYNKLCRFDIKVIMAIKIKFKLKIPDANPGLGYESTRVGYLTIGTYLKSIT